MFSTQPLKISIQGYYGSFHHQAAYLLFGDTIELVQRDNFVEVISDVISQKTDYAVMAIHNNNIGSITSAQQLLTQHSKNIEVLDEITLPINQHLVTTKEAHLEQINQIQSHPLALAQCSRFLHLHPHIKLSKSVDTGLSVKYIVENNTCHIGSIAGTFAAEKYNAKILYSRIQDREDNQTTFALIAKIN